MDISPYSIKIERRHQNPPPVVLPYNGHLPPAPRKSPPRHRLILAISLTMVVCMHLRNLLLLAVLVTGLSNAFAWSVKGNVRSSTGNAIAGVQVTVVDSAHRVTTSDAQGNFEINSSTTLLPQAGKAAEALQYRLEGNSLTIFHPRDGMMTLSLSTASGKQVWSRPVMIENGLARTQLPDHILNKPLFLSLRDPVGKRQFLRREIALVSLLPSYPRLRFQKAGYTDAVYSMLSDAESNVQITMREVVAPSPTDFTETVNGVSFSMTYIPGGTFTIGCEKATCPSDTKPVAGVTVSGYHIGKTEVTRGLWQAVMGEAPAGYGTSSSSNTNLTWYASMEFACRLSQLTGRRYRMTTEAEWEYAAKNHLSSLEKIGTGEEWAYNSWNSTHTGGTDPLGPSSGQHTQKTRRDAQGTADNITGRLIRSIEGEGPALRLAVSATTDYPPGLIPPCGLHAPQLGPEPVNSYRDPRWITGSDSAWVVGSIAIGSFNLMVWEDGTARLGTTNGQWFTSNNIALVFVPNTGSSTKFAYIFLNGKQASLISDQGFAYGSGGYIGRIEKLAATHLDKPTISGLKSGAELASAAGPNFKMVDMANIPQAARQKDARLLDGTSHGWFQDNRQAGGVHHYRKDVDADEFRFTVNQGGNRTMLANGDWFTVNNTFLRITHSTGYTADYLYAVDASGTFYHNSFMAYERGDFRMFKKTTNNSDTLSLSCGDICIGEIPKGAAASLYSNMKNGKSTFTPAECPTGGCQ